MPSSSAEGTASASSNLCPGVLTGSQASGTEYRESTRTLNRLLKRIGGGGVNESYTVNNSFSILTYLYVHT